LRMHTQQGPAVFSRGLLNAWGCVLADIGADRENEVLVITGTGEHWINGVDPASFTQPLSAWSADERYEQYRDGCRALESLVHDVEIPTIAAVNGPGIRLEIALLCDLTLCTDDTVIGDGNFAAGSVPGDGMHRVLAELIGPKRAAHLVYTGQRLDAETALQLGLVSEVVPREQLTARAHEIAQRITAAPRAVRRMTHTMLARDWQRRVVDGLRGAYAHQILEASH
jgi:enoyl-CoA hydratase/carnithine racemase